MTDIASRLQQVFRETFDDPTLVVEDGTTASDVPDWDSLAHVSLVVAVEREFGIRFTAAEVSGLSCVGDLRKAIQGKTGR